MPFMKPFAKGKVNALVVPSAAVQIGEGFGGTAFGILHHRLCLLLTTDGAGANLEAVMEAVCLLGDGPIRRSCGRWLE